MLDKLKELYSKYPYLTYILGGLILFIPIFIFSRRKKNITSHAKGGPIQIIPSSKPTPLPIQGREKITKPQLENREEEPEWASDILNVINNNRKRLDDFGKKLKNEGRNNNFLQNIEGRIKEKQTKRPIAPTKIPLAPIEPRSTRTHVQGIIPKIFENIEKVAPQTVKAIKNITQHQKDIVNNQYRNLREKVKETGKTVEQIIGRAPTPKGDRKRREARQRFSKIPTHTEKRSVKQKDGTTRVFVPRRLSLRERRSKDMQQRIAEKNRYTRPVEGAVRV